jgi:hypothetical protein
MQSAAAAPNGCIFRLLPFTENSVSTTAAQFAILPIPPGY